MSIKLLFMVFAASMGIFLYNRANATGQLKPGADPGLLPSTAREKPGGAGAEALLPDVTHPYSQSTQNAVTYHSDLGSGYGSDGSSFSDSLSTDTYATTTTPSTQPPGSQLYRGTYNPDPSPPNLLPYITSPTPGGGGSGSARVL